MRPLRLLALAALLVAGHLGWNVHRALALREESGVLMPAAGGALEQLELQFSGLGAERFLEVYAQLVPALDPGTEVVVTVEGPADEARFAAAFRGWFPRGAARPALRFVHTGRPITSWARDRLAVIGGSGGEPLTLLAPPAPMVGPAQRVHDWVVPWTLADRLPGPPRIRAAAFRFEGGDLIADASHVFVATPLFERNPGLAREGKLLARVEAATGLRALRVDAPGAPSPDHHIGMFVTPLGEGRVAVADPLLGLELLEAAGLLRDDLRLEIGGHLLTLDVSAERLARFATVARRLEEEGLEVIPLPALPTTSRYVIASWNNALMERRGGRLQIYLPTYGLPALDDHAAAVLEAAGARVHPIRVDRLFRLGGSVRCLTAPLRRGA
ncbi:MAG: agmatine deiminase family protein [Deltaproteobacteria bacterium]|nr:agmatine deiminase family protein [Deltaproteobacteria bacterium]